MIDACVPTFRHPFQIVFVKKLTLLALLAQTTKPVFAHDGAILTRVPLWTLTTGPTSSFQVKLAYIALAYARNQLLMM